MDEDTSGGEGIDETALGLVQRGVGDPDGLRSVARGGDLDSVGSKVSGNARIVKGAGTQVGQLEGTVKDIDAAVGAIIGGEEEILAFAAADREAGVGSAHARAVSRESGVSAADARIPAADGAVLSGKDEDGLAGLAVLGNDKIASGVANDAGGRAMTATDKR